MDELTPMIETYSDGSAAMAYLDGVVSVYCRPIDIKTLVANIAIAGALCAAWQDGFRGAMSLE